MNRRAFLRRMAAGAMACAMLDLVPWRMEGEVCPPRQGEIVEVGNPYARYMYGRYLTYDKVRKVYGQ